MQRMGRSGGQTCSVASRCQAHRRNQTTGPAVRASMKLRLPYEEGAAP